MNSYLIRSKTKFTFIKEERSCQRECIIRFFKLSVLNNDNRDGKLCDHAAGVFHLLTPINYHLLCQTLYKDIKSLSLHQIIGTVTKHTIYFYRKSNIFN